MEQLYRWGWAGGDEGRGGGDEMGRNFIHRNINYELGTCSILFFSFLQRDLLLEAFWRRWFLDERGIERKKRSCCLGRQMAWQAFLLFWFQIRENRWKAEGARRKWPGDDEREKKGRIRKCIHCLITGCIVTLGGYFTPDVARERDGARGTTNPLAFHLN